MISMSHEENITDSWEQYAEDESELEKRLAKEKQDMSTSNGVTVNGNDNFKPRILQRQPKKPEQNQIKILKRPQFSGATGSSNPSTQVGCKPQMKTLEQREKEYAEARKRILGSECDQIDKQVVYSKVSPSTSSNNLQSFNNQSQQQQKIPDNVIRQPKGPNNSNPGFRIRR